MNALCCFKEGNDASSRLKGWEIHYIWKLVVISKMLAWPEANVLQQELGESLSAAHLLTPPSLLGVPWSKNNSGLLEHVMYHWCDALMGIHLSPTKSCSPEKCHNAQALLQCHMQF